MAQTNRYPSARNSAARDYQERPRSRPRDWVPANDNTPRRKPPSWIPANDNRPVPKPNEWSPPSRPRIPGYKEWLRYMKRVSPWLLYGLTAYEIWEWYQNQKVLDLSSLGFVLLCTRPGPKPRMRYLGGKGGDSCGVTAQPMGEEATSIPPLPPPVKTWGITRDHIEFYLPTSKSRGTIMEVWDRSNTYGNPPRPGWEPGKEPTPWLPPVIPPFYPTPDPWEDPFVTPNYPKEPRRRPRVKSPTDPRPRLPEDRVSEEPSFRPTPTPDRPPLPRPPRKHERERKIRIRDMPNKRLRRIMGWLISAASEAGDFLDILYGALPDDLTNSDANTKEKFETVFKNLDKVDFDKFVSDLWQNEVQDRYFGKGFGDMSDALEQFGLELPSLKL